MFWGRFICSYSMVFEFGLLEDEATVYSWGEVTSKDGRASLVAPIFLRVIHLDFKDFADERREDMNWIFDAFSAFKTCDRKSLKILIGIGPLWSRDFLWDKCLRIISESVCNESHSFIYLCFIYENYTVRVKWTNISL